MTHKPGILLAAFGATTPLGAHAIALFENQVREAFPHIPVRWAFTSPAVRERLAKNRVKTDSVGKALERMRFEKFTHIAVQSLHLIPGSEYEMLAGQCKEIEKRTGLSLHLGTPLLHTPADVANAARALLCHLPPTRQLDEAVVCMGHSTSHSAAASYEALGVAVAQHDARVFVGTLDGEPGLETLFPALRSCGAKKVWLLPLLSVIGKHAQIDMAGEQATSWKSRVSAHGFACEAVLKGTAQYSAFVAIWLDHLGKALAAQR